MFWVAVKVIFFRQIYGMKRRWVMVLCTVLYTTFFLLLLPVTRVKELQDQMEDKNDSAVNPVFSQAVSSGIPNPLTIVVVPHDSKVRELISGAYHVLVHESRNASLLNVHVAFMNNFEHMRQTLRKSMWPSIGVEVHEITSTKLEYTLHPFIAPGVWDSPEKLDLSIAQRPKGEEEMSRGLLRLQAAIDAAYVQTHFPDRPHLRIRGFPDSRSDFPDSPGGFLDSPGGSPDSPGDSPDYPGDDQGARNPSANAMTNLYNAGFFLSLSPMLMMVMLASYIIRDKVSGVRELLCVNGMPRWIVNTSWMFTFILLGLVVAVLQLTLTSFPRDNPSFKFINLPLLFVSLIIYGWTALVFANLVAHVFTSQLFAILLIILYWVVACIASFFLIVSETLNELLVAQALIAMMPNFGFMLFIGVLLEFYKVNTELSFRNLFSSPNEYISAGMVLLMMLISILIFFTLALYLDAVKPGPYGRARPWYLFNSRTAKVGPEVVSREEEKLFENFNEDEPVGLNCVNIVKIFGTHTALNNVNLNIIKNRVTVLLGHNGAGKTTLFSILCGMFSPTSGDVYTDEYSIFEGNNIHKFRRVLGYCPQENLVLNELSVQEHLIVFGMLKGLTRSEAREFSDKWTRMFGMYKLRHTQAKKLSGGTKRKLCLAIAMTGEPRYLLLDEPSAGMDIESTRKMWDVLLEEKGKCTVVITTHNMDEAEILGDRIAILAHGQLKCLGTSSFLKKTLDSGYRLNCAATNKNTEDVIRSVTKTIRNVSVPYKTNRSVTFSLPSNQVSSIPELLRSLEKEFGESVSSTLSLSTLDDVFIKVQKDVGVKVNVEELPFVAKDEMDRSAWNCTDLFCNRLKWLMSMRAVTMIILVILLPNLAMIGGIFVIYEDLQNASTPPDTSPGKPSGMFALLSNHHDDVSDLLRSTLSKSGIPFKETGEGITASLIDMAQKDVFKYRSKLLFAFDTLETARPTAYFTSRTDRAVSVAYSALVNALLAGNATIITHNVPFSYKRNFEEARTGCRGPFIDYTVVLVFLIVGPFFLVASAYFVVFPHEERTTLFKHLQLMTGLLPAAYWTMNLIFDLLIYIICCLLTAIVVASMDYKIDVFLDSTVFSALMLTLILYGLSSILLSYVGSFFFHTSAVAIILVVSAPLLVISVAKSIDLIGFLKTEAYFKRTFFLPWPVLWNAYHKILFWALEKRTCKKCHIQRSCDYSKKKLFQEELKIELICFVGLAIVYFLILLFLDHGLGRRMMGLVQQLCCGKIKYANGEVDPEVALEERRVDSLASKDEDDWPELVCDGLGKKYSCKRTAVYNVTFTVERGECFGLVGVNGAGKSTTFGMLAALLSPTKGTAVIEGRWKVTGCNYRYLKRVGYCPQYEGLLRELPARTIIKLFGRLGGVPRNQIDDLVDKWINALDMADIAKRPCGQYSGGNKRKLSLAMALIGNPPVVLLDEPTAGVDPVVRRKIWEILTTSLEKHERTIILTSHTMSECEAICDRLTIMVKGVMKCLGPIPVLKKTFGKSCILEVKFTINSPIKRQRSVQAKIESQFAGNIHLHETQPSRLVFFLKTDNFKMYDLFAIMLMIQSEYAIIEDFNLSETPLEQVFLMFAQDKSISNGN